MRSGVCASKTTRLESSPPWAHEAGRFHPDTREYRHEGYLQYSPGGKTPWPTERSRALQADWWEVLLNAGVLQATEVDPARMRAKHSALLDRQQSREREVCFVRKRYANDYAGRDPGPPDLF